MARLLESFLSVLEKGAAWTAEIGTNKYNLYEALSEMITFFVDELKRMADDLDPLKTTDTIADFQKDLNLPRCQDPANDDEARAEIIATLIQSGPFKQNKVQEIADVYNIGDVLLSSKGVHHLGIRFLDYESVEYPRCGVARCGVATLSKLLTPVSQRGARCGVARCGSSKLAELLLNKNFFCQIEALRPDWTQLDFDFL